MATAPLHSLIAPEIRVYVFLTSIAIIVLHIFFGWWVLPLWAGVAMLIWLFRDPVRHVPASPLGVISPADGQVVAVAGCHDPYLERDATCIHIHMPFTGTYALHGVVEGKIMQHWFHQAGPAADDSTRHIVWIQTDEKDDLVVAMYPGRLLGRMKCYVATGERVGQGQRCGFIPFGSTVEVFLSTQSRPLVKQGDQVLGGETTIAQLIHN